MSGDRILNEQIILFFVVEIGPVSEVKIDFIRLLFDMQCSVLSSLIQKTKLTPNFGSRKICIGGFAPRLGFRIKKFFDP